MKTGLITIEILLIDALILMLIFMKDALHLTGYTQKNSTSGCYSGAEGHLLLYVCLFYVCAAVAVYLDIVNDDQFVNPKGITSFLSYGICFKAILCRFLIPRTSIFLLNLTFVLGQLNLLT